MAGKFDIRKLVGIEDARAMELTLQMLEYLKESKSSYDFYAKICEGSGELTVEEALFMGIHSSTLLDMMQGE